MTAPGPLMRLVRETQRSERHPHCPHGMRERAIPSLEAWFHERQPDGHIEYWLHVANVANPELAMRIYRASLLRLLSRDSRCGQEAAEALNFLLRFGAAEETQAELERWASASAKRCPPRARKHVELAWRTARWALGREETVGPVFCVPLLCHVAYKERAADPARPNYYALGRELWQWWKTLTTPEEWAGGHF